MESIAQTGTDEPSRRPARIQLPSSGIHILVVDQNNINRIVHSRMLEKMGHTVATVCDGQEAVDYLCKTSTQRRPDFVFMNSHSYNDDGYEATRRIRNDVEMFDAPTRSLPIVALTYVAGPGVREKCLEAGMTDCHLGIITFSVLKEAVLKWTSYKET